MAVVVFNSILRLPVMFAAANATMMIGEVARRGLVNIICQAMNMEPKVTTQESSWRDKAFDLFCPHHKTSLGELLVCGIASAVLGAIGWEFVNFGIGSLPPQYNQVGRYISPLVLDGNWRHPLIAAGLRLFGR